MNIFTIPDFCPEEWKLASCVEELPRLPGLYAICSDCTLQDCLYVGKSESSIRTRVTSFSHKPWLLASSKFTSPVILYRVIEIASHHEMCLQECFAIGVFRPSLNFGRVDWSDEKLVRQEKIRRFKESFKNKPEEWQQIEERLVRDNISLETYLYPYS